MDKVLTVVIPAYNVEKYVKKTLDSFLDRSILNNIEVLVVDDGSQDDTAKIAQEYQEKYPQTFRLIQKENGGHGSTINRGIEVASGKFFKVVDGDDWVNTKDFVKLINLLKYCNSDYVFTNYYEVYEPDFTIKEKSYPFIDGNEYSFKSICSDIQIPMHALVIKTSILKNHHIRLDEHCFYVDVEYILYPIPYVSTVTFFNLYVYMYRLAISTQSVSTVGYQKHMKDHISVIMHLLDFLNQYEANGAPYEKRRYIVQRISEMVLTQSAIYGSYSVTADKKIKKSFIIFDQEVKAKNNMVYQFAEQSSGKLRALHKTHFHFYALISYFSKIRNLR